MDAHGSHESHCHHHGHGTKKPFYKDFLFILLVATAVLLATSYVIPVLAHFRHAFYGYVRLMAFPIVLGLFAGGLIDYFIPKEYISKYLARKSKRVVLYAAGLGFVASACSHGVLALSMELHKKGASGPAVISFLLASPWANLPITILLIGFFGWKGLVIIIAALLIAISTGLIFQFLDSRGWIEHNPHSVTVATDFSIWSDFQRRRAEYRLSVGKLAETCRGVVRGMWMLTDMVMSWVLIGMILASLASAFVPEGVFDRFFGPTVGGLLVTLLAASILEVCSEGTSPLAFELYKQTGALGNAFAFLMSGVVTDVTEIGLVWKNLGKKSALWMIGVTLPQVLVLGWLFNLIF